MIKARRKQDAADATRISGPRKSAYYLGMVVSAAGLLLFLSTFFMMSSFPVVDMQGSMERALGGMALMFLGRVITVIGARGVAGSGVTLDPDQARRDLSPYSRMAGGMVNDALAEVKTTPAPHPQVEVVKVRCQRCASLNAEAAKFCNQCGKPI